MKDNLIKKFLKFSYGSWAGLILGLLTTMVTTRILPPDAFGQFSMFDLFLKVGMILTVFGTDQAFIRFFYEEEPEKRGALLYNSLRVPILTTVLMIVITLIFYKPITNFMIGDADFSFAIVFIIGIIAQLLFRYAQLVIRMQQKGNLYSLLQILQRVFNLLFIFIVFFIIGSSFKVLVFSKVMTFIILVVVGIYFGRQFWNPKNLKVKNVKHSQSEVIRFGTPFVFTIFITWLLESFDKIAIRQWADFDELGLYAAAMRLVALVMVLRQTFSTFWTPVAYEKFENKPDDRDFFRYISTAVAFVMFLVAILSIAGKDIIVILLGGEYKEAASIMPFLVFMPIFYTISETTVMGINFYKKTQWHLVIAGIACGVNILGNWLLVPEFGAIGASFSTAFSYIIFFSLRTQISLKYFKVKYPLFKIYFMVLVVMAYAVYSILITDFWVNILMAIVPLIILIVVFYKDLVYIFQNRKELLG
ncbi:lipopolysaccharide biosynthesis protein [Lentibacillus sp. CBA3610]|uniref:lipopolysaccharide biosynthesis protein n=1 Tax=Lentibacillus sp. CBA3610 TaxID=2518176 RepID=UPI001595F464|nr:oligosaccharide flippase family protein [Lentibacillus sp. CBA3610]QKY70299.1 hypothetical protein Len3610_12475 [Lentibacillus sp. CBA3610]